MPSSMDFVRSAIDAIGRFEAQNARLAKDLKFLCDKPLPLGADWTESAMMLPVDDLPFDGRVAGIDSGFVDKPLFGFSLLIVRAVGVVFEFDSGKMKKAYYYPSGHAFPVPRLSSKPLDALALTENNGLQRLIEELETAKAVIRQYRPDYCFLDGSIVPQYSMASASGGPNQALFGKVVESLESLFVLAEESNTQLVGCVEDSRATRFRDLIQELFDTEKKTASRELAEVYDAVLLDHWLAHRQRTAVFSYTANPSSHPQLSKLSERHQSAIHVFYCRPAALDRPLRVEFFAQKHQSSERAARIASTVQALSGHHREYAYPSILIEADLCARLRPEEIDLVYNKIIDRLGKRFSRGLRRNARPF